MAKNLVEAKGTQEVYTIGDLEQERLLQVRDATDKAQVQALDEVGWMAALTSGHFEDVAGSPEELVFEHA